MSDLLASLTDDELRELEPLFRERHFADGDYLFRQGDVSTGAYIIDSGHIDLDLLVVGGGREVLYRVDPGQILGEPALLRSAERQLGARAVGDVATRFVEQLDFQGLRNSFRPVTFKVMLAIARSTGRRLHQSNSTEAQRAVACAHEPAPAPQPLGEAEERGASFDPRAFMRLLPMFREFGSSDMDELLALGELFELSRGRTLVNCGQRSDRCWIVLRGAVEALNPKSGKRGALFGPGKLAGQLAPLLAAPSIATFRVRENALLLQLGPAALGTLLKPDRRVSFRFVNALTIDLLRGLERANRVLARTTKERLVTAGRDARTGTPR